MAAAKLSVPWRPGRAGSFAPDPASRIFRRQNDLAPPDRLFQRSLVLVTSYIRGHAFFYGATPGFFQRRQLGHGFILIIKERQHVADNGRSEEHTSELQSLMRNPYAVFCLKQNTDEFHIKHKSIQASNNPHTNIIKNL